MSQASRRTPYIFVRFEQGRGKGGVPKTYVPWLVQETKTYELSTIIKMALGLLRAQCADPILGHGQDIMPGADDEYCLHNVDGGKLEKVEDIHWEIVNGVKDYAELVLTWKNSAEMLIDYTHAARTNTPSD